MVITDVPVEIVRNPVPAMMLFMKNTIKLIETTIQRKFIFPRVVADKYKCGSNITCVLEKA